MCRPHVSEARGGGGRCEELIKSCLVVKVSCFLVLRSRVSLHAFPCQGRPTGERERESRERAVLGNNVHDGGVQGAAR